MKKNIIVTGANGLLGQKIVQQLLTFADVNVIAMAKGENRAALREGYTYLSADIADDSLWKQVFEEYKPDSLIHTAAMTQVDMCEDERELSMKINAEVVRDMALLCKTYGAHLVHISTDFIFSGEKGYYTEDDTPDPVNYYGLTKLRAEEYIKESGADAAILRTILLYGIVPAMSRTNIVLWAKDALSQGKNIKVVNDQERCPTLAEDLAAAAIAAAFRKAKGIFHICGPEKMNIIDVVYKVADFWGLDKSLITQTDSTTLNQKAQRPPRTAFHLEKAERELGYKPHSFVEGLVMLDKQIKEISKA